jgi:uncharacterized protein (DUF58 family)
MSRLVLLSLIIYALVLAGLGTLSGGLLPLAIPLVLYLGAGLLYEPQAPRLRAARSLSAAHVAQNAPVVVTLTITNEGPALEQVTISDAYPRGMALIEGETALITALPAGASIELVYTLSGKRGSYEFGGVRVAVSDMLALFRKRVTLEAPGQIFVLPEVVRVRQAQIRPRRTRVYSGQIPARQGGPGVEFFGVRPYQPGDPLRWVNDRVSARHEEALYVNEFEQERAADVSLILDARRRSDARAGRDSLFEHAVLAAASLAQAFLSSGNRVGLLVYGGAMDWTIPGYGKVQRERILRSLARARLGDSPVFEELNDLPTHLFPTRSQLVLISPLLGSDLRGLVRLRALGFPLLVISPDPVSFERAALDDSAEIELAARIARMERELLLRKLRQTGSHVVDWQVEVPFFQVAQVALSRPPGWAPVVGNL